MCIQRRQRRREDYKGWRRSRRDCRRWIRLRGRSKRGGMRMDMMDGWKEKRKYMEENSCKLLVEKEQEEDNQLMVVELVVGGERNEEKILKKIVQKVMEINKMMLIKRSSKVQRRLVDQKIIRIMERIQKRMRILIKSQEFHQFLVLQTPRRSFRFKRKSRKLSYLFLILNLTLTVAFSPSSNIKISSVSMNSTWMTVILHTKK